MGRNKKSEDEPSSLLGHGANRLAAVLVDDYNAEMYSGDEFVGDRASKGAFQEILDGWREQLAKFGEDPLGEMSGGECSKQELDDILAGGDEKAAGLIHSAIEDFSQEFASVVRRFLRLKAWKPTQRLVVGGGFRQSRIGELVIGRTEALLKAKGDEIELRPITNHPDHAGLIGAVHLVPAWILAGHDCILAIDIGGTSIRAGVVALPQTMDLSNASVRHLEVWHHSQEKPSRDDAVAHLVLLLQKLINKASEGNLALAPFIGIGCPGVIRADGSIARGAQNLPGNWQAKTFNLPRQLCTAIPTIGAHESVVLMHNDAVVQGLSQLPDMKDVETWGVFTIGTGLGNAHFTNRPDSGQT